MFFLLLGFYLFDLIYSFPVDMFGADFADFHGKDEAEELKKSEHTE